MKNVMNKNLKSTSLLAIIFAIFLIRCERDISDSAVLATFPNTADIFTDAPVGLTDAFFESFDPAAGANPTGFGVDNTIAYVGTTSIRLDVPAPNDPEGGFIGGIFRDRGAGRNLTGYDCLTFWAKASTTGTFGTVGFGVDFAESKHETTVTEMPLTTGWKKYIIPIPDPSKLTQERGLFLFAAGTNSTNSMGYTIWIDELRFEKLGNISLINPFILNGQDLTVDGFLGSNQEINQLGAVFSLANGQNVQVNAAPAYFTFESSNTSVTGPFVNNTFSIIGSTGTAVISARIKNILAQGSITVNASGAFVNAPNPTTNPANVISVYSDFYSTIQGFNPGVFAGPNTVSITTNTFANNQHIRYEGIDFVGMGWNGTINASSKTMVHLDVKLISGSNVVMELIDFGPDGIDNGFGPNNGTAGGNNISGQLQQNEWVSLDIPLNAFTLATGGGGGGNPNRNNLGFIVFVSNNGATFLVDNVYFYN